MPVVVDGNNLLHSLSPQHRSRADVRRHALDLVRRESLHVFVVFDGPPPQGSPAIEYLGRVTVRYSGVVAADDVIIEMLPAGREAGQWVVVTDDHALRARARSKGTAVRTLAEWRRRRPPARRSGHESRLSSHEIAQWEEFFAQGGDNEDP